MLRKNLVWISGAFFYDAIREVLVSPEILPMLKENNIALYLAGERGLVAPASGADRAVNRRQPLNARAPPPNDALQNMDLRHVAESTGGLGFFETNDLRGSIEKALEDTAVTYTLGFYPSEAALDGTMHPLKVKVARKGVEVRYRDGYYASSDSISAQPRGPAIDELANDPLDATAVGLTAAERQSGIDVKVSLRDLHLDREGERWRVSFDLALYLEGEKKMNLRTVNLDLNEEQLKAALESPYAISTPLPFGATGLLRVVVRDRATGNAGSLRMRLK